MAFASVDMTSPTRSRTWKKCRHTRRNSGSTLPVSRVVQGDEMFLECRAGRVAFIDMPTFMHEVKENVEEVVEQLRKEPKVRRLTSPVGAFRLQYVFEREQGLLESDAIFATP